MGSKLCNKNCKCQTFDRVHSNEANKAIRTRYINCKNIKREEKVEERGETHDRFDRKRFFHSNCKWKNFTKIIAKGKLFENSNLIGCQFYEAFMIYANFKCADLCGATLKTQAWMELC